MRISCLKEDTGYEAYLINRNADITVYVDGELIDDVITADDESGYVLAMNRDDEGKVMLNNDKSKIVERELLGKVKIVLGKDQGE